jgi:hypothetical protein
MAQLIILYWCDIPAQIIVKAGRKSAKKQLTDRFQEAIDMAAMKSKAHKAGTYLEKWRRSEPYECGENLEGEAIHAAQKIEKNYDDERLNALIKTGGKNYASTK